MGLFINSSIAIRVFGLHGIRKPLTCQILRFLGVWSDIIAITILFSDSMNVSLSRIFLYVSVTKLYQNICIVFTVQSYFIGSQKIPTIFYWNKKC